MIRIRMIGVVLLVLGSAPARAELWELWWWGSANTPVATALDTETLTVDEGARAAWVYVARGGTDGSVLGVSAIQYAWYCESQQVVARQVIGFDPATLDNIGSFIPQDEPESPTAGSTSAQLMDFVCAYEVAATQKGPQGGFGKPESNGIKILVEEARRSFEVMIKKQD